MTISTKCSATNTGRARSTLLHVELQGQKEEERRGIRRSKKIRNKMRKFKVLSQQTARFRN